MYTISVTFCPILFNFLQITENCVFLDTKRNFFKNFKILQKKNRNAKSPPNSRQSGNTEKFWYDRKKLMLDSESPTKNG